MAITSMGLLPGRGVSLGKITEGKAKAKWLAVSDSIFDNESMVLAYGYAHELLPVPYLSVHPLYPIMLCRDIRVDQDSSSPCKWDIEANYSSEPLKQPEDQIPDPTQRPAKIKWKSQAYRKAVTQDRDGYAIVNSAGDYFDPPPEIDSSHWIATIEKNVAIVPSVILSYTDAINSNGFTISGISVSPEVAKIVDLDISDQQQEGDYLYHVFTYGLEFRPEGWKLKPLDQGFRYKSGSDRKNILDNSTPPRPITSPKLLDGSGAVLSNPTTTNAVFLEYDVYNDKDFSILPGISEVGD